jgi:hypothetical protein
MRLDGVGRAADHGTLPANYAAVLARCELARASLGLCIDEAALDRLVGASPGSSLATHPGGTTTRPSAPVASTSTPPISISLPSRWRRRRASRRA